MQADSLPSDRGAERDEQLRAAGHVLERAFRDDNGLSPSVRLLRPKDAQPTAPAHAPLEQESDAPSVTISAGKIHDPRLLAVFGLYYFDLGDSCSARELLESATQTEAPRPAAYLTLARLNLDAALAKPEGHDGMFSADQVAAILTPLFSVIKRWNLDIRGYRLIAETWSHSGAKPSLANLQVLESGLKRYPFDSSLLYSTATVYARWGYFKEANETVERSTRFADQATVEKLHSAQSIWSVTK
jgi:hypothetical protein